MNIFKKIYCRSFQTVFKIALPFLPYRKPKIVSALSDIPSVLNKKKKSCPIIITDPGIAKLGILSMLTDVFDNAGIKYHDAKFNAALTGMFTTDRASGWGDLLPVNFIAGYKFDKSSSVELGVENIFDRDDIVSNPGSATKYYCLPRMVHVTYTYTF